MDDTKALSSEVKSLISSIHAQAQAYNAAFEMFERDKKKYEKLYSEINDFVSQSNEKVNNALSSNIDSINATLSNTEELFRKTQIVYDELDKIVSLKDKLYFQQEVLKKMISDFELFKVSANAELQSLIETLVPRIDEAVESEIEKLIQKHEIRVALQLKRFETKFMSIDQKFWTVSDTQLRQYKELLDEIDILKNKISGLSRNSNDFKKNIEFSREDTDGKFMNKMQQLDSYLSQLQAEKLNRNIIGNDFTTFEADARIKLKNIDTKIESMIKDFKSSETQRKLTFVASVFAVIGFIVLAIFLMLR